MAEGEKDNEADSADATDEVSAEAKDPAHGLTDLNVGGIYAAQGESEDEQGHHEVVNALEEPGGHLG
jgi:hypothetical protein